MADDHGGAAAAKMDSRVKVMRIIHTIHVTADLSACRTRYLDLLGGLIFAEDYFEAEDRDMALLYVANHMIEPMAPRDPARLDKHVARYRHASTVCRPASPSTRAISSARDTNLLVGPTGSPAGSFSPAPWAG